ncbi:hypothetical protein J7J18_04665 [bacterium]|nr:hypothetical protein [bacterium]
MEVNLSAEELKKRIKSFIKEKPIGLKWVSEIKRENPKEILINGFPKKVLDNLDKYPTLKNHPPNFHVVDIKTFPNGKMQIEGIIRDGKEKTKEYQAFGILIPSDKELFELEKKQFKKGKLKEVAERTLKFHRLEDYWNDLSQKIKKKQINIKNH